MKYHTVVDFGYNIWDYLIRLLDFRGDNRLHNELPRVKPRYPLQELKKKVGQAAGYSSSRESGIKICTHKAG
jgi:hypothetical protein